MSFSIDEVTMSSLHSTNNSKNINKIENYMSTIQHNYRSWQEKKEIWANKPLPNCVEADSFFPNFF